jgi:hypothetical protein
MNIMKNIVLKSNIPVRAGKIQFRKLNLELINPASLSYSPFTQEELEYLG